MSQSGQLSYVFRLQTCFSFLLLVEESSKVLHTSEQTLVNYHIYMIRPLDRVCYTQHELDILSHNGRQGDQMATSVRCDRDTKDDHVAANKCPAGKQWTKLVITCLKDKIIEAKILTGSSADDSSSNKTKNVVFREVFRNL
ncbi:hypothetical protein ACS0TY_011599 [Phlomoides rotata]